MWLARYASWMEQMQAAQRQNDVPVSTDAKEAVEDMTPLAVAERAERAEREMAEMAEMAERAKMAELASTPSQPSQPREVVPPERDGRDSKLESPRHRSSSPKHLSTRSRSRTRERSGRRLRKKHRSKPRSTSRSRSRSHKKREKKEKTEKRKQSQKRSKKNAERSGSETRASRTERDYRRKPSSQQELQEVHVVKAALCSGSRCSHDTVSSMKKKFIEIRNIHVIIENP